MRILHLNITEKFGGAAQAANRLHHSLLDLGVDSTLLVVNKESNDESVIPVADIYSKTDKLQLLFRRGINIFKTVFHLNKEKKYNPPSFLLGVLGRIDFDIIHLHWVTGSFVNFKEIAGIKKPIVWTMHDCAAFTGICHVIGSCSNFKTGCGRCPLLNSNNINDISSREFYRKKEIIRSLTMTLVSPSRWIAKNASMSPMLNGKTIKVIPHGLDTYLFKPMDKLSARRVFNFSSDTKIIVSGSVTFNDKNKGIHLFAEAINTIADLNTEIEKYEVVLFGEVTDDKTFSRVKTTKLGYINDNRLLKVIYSLSDVVVVPSLQESFGQTALEALSCGIPVVAFAATGLLDIVDHKINGYLAKPYDSTDLASGIVWCLDNNIDNKLSANARQKVTDNFDIKLIAQRYRELYDSLINK